MQDYGTAIPHPSRNWNYECVRFYSNLEDLSHLHTHAILDIFVGKNARAELQVMVRTARNFPRNTVVSPPGYHWPTYLQQVCVLSQLLLETLR